MSGTAVFNIAANEVKSGRVVVDGGFFQIGGDGYVSSLNINVEDLTTTLPIGGPRNYKIFGDTVNGGSVVLLNNVVSKRRGYKRF